ncbi:AraC family transcriptional regulator [Phenylobacterium sp.]|uniref:AraC family transcriptional regulator n=1 Tax=Phenylobacterium sp. TaxID=1871053 RepID=UPI002FE23884
MDELRAIAARHLRGTRTETPVPRLALHSGCEATELQPGLVAEPMLVLVLQGAKEALVGERLLRYSAGCYAIASVELAVCGRIALASRDRPYIGATLALDRDALAGLLPELPGGRSEPTPAGFGVSTATLELAEAWLRLLRLLDRPADVPVLAPLIEREILYWLLQGPQAAMLRQLAAAGSRLSQVRRAMSWIREHYREPLRIEALAGLSGMSPASFHRHFKAATGMSPLQFQKSLRLQHARRLLITDHDAARAGYAVGYESASQFSREYARLFGAPPARDAQRLRREGLVVEPA